MTGLRPFREIAADVYDDPERMADVAVMVAAMRQGIAIAGGLDVPPAAGAKGAAVERARPIEDVLPQVYGDPDRMARIGRMAAALRDALALAAAREQANVSRIERQDDLYLSTLREYVEALGGRLEVRAVFPDRVVTLDPRRRPDRRRKGKSDAAD